MLNLQERDQAQALYQAAFMQIDNLLGTAKHLGFANSTQENNMRTVANLLNMMSSYKEQTLKAHKPFTLDLTFGSIMKKILRFLG